jgi:hypothetical protein
VDLKTVQVRQDYFSRSLGLPQVRFEDGFFDRGAKAAAEYPLFIPLYNATEACVLLKVLPGVEDLKEQLLCAPVFGLAITVENGFLVHK